MTYLSSIERIGMEIGMQKGLQQGIQEGRQQGIQEGLQQGMRQGQAELLIELITTRFGPIDFDTRLKLAAANPKQISAWARNFVDAQTLDDVFHNK